MSRLLIIEPMAVAAIAASRGSGADNLPSPSPKEVWADAAAGSAATIQLDLGSIRTVDTIFLGHLRNASADATWAISAAGAGNVAVQPSSMLRVPDVADTFAALSHALWHGPAFTARTITLTLNQPAGAAPLVAGSLVVGKAFTPALGQEWGGGRQPVDTGTSTALPDGGFAIVEGVRKRRFSWTFGDLSIEEADRLEIIALALGETRPGLVVEDAARTAGLISRIHYGKFDRWKGFERRNRAQTRWELGVEQWL